MDTSDKNKINRINNNKKKSKSGLPLDQSAGKRTELLTYMGIVRGANLRELMDITDISEKELSSLIQKDKTTLSRYIKSSICLSVKTIVFLCGTLMLKGWFVPYAWLLENKEDINNFGDIREEHKQDIAPYRIDQVKTSNHQVSNPFEVIVESEDFQKSHFISQFIYLLCNNNPDRFAVLVTDNNLSIAKSGDVIICKKVNPEEIVEEKYYAISKNGGEFFIGKAHFDPKDDSFFFLTNNKKTRIFTPGDTSFNIDQKSIEIVDNKVISPSYFTLGEVISCGFSE